MELAQYHFSETNRVIKDSIIAVSNTKAKPMNILDY